jgi:hypothetical protein
MPSEWPVPAARLLDAVAPEPTVSRTDASFYGRIGQPMRCKRTARRNDPLHSLRKVDVSAIAEYL